MWVVGAREGVDVFHPTLSKRGKATDPKYPFETLQDFTQQKGWLLSAHKLGSSNPQGNNNGPKLFEC